MSGELDPAIWAELIADWGLNPDTTEIVDGSVQVRGWDAGVGDGKVQRMKYYRATLRARRAGVVAADLEALYIEARKAKPAKKVKTGGETLLVCLADWQASNPDFGGIEAQVQAIADLNESIPQRVADLRKSGHEVGTIALVGLGDLVEGTCGFYPSQEYRVEVDRREQVKMVRRGLRDIIMSCAPHAESIKVACVPGNHGENRKDGKSFTTVGDNDDVAVFEQVAEILSQNSNGAFDHVQWRIPGDEIAIAVELSGQIVAFTHGHVARGSGNAAEVMWNWWKNQAMGRHYESVADATMLFTGHYHHLCVKEQTGRAVFVCPSLTRVGEYFANSAGVTTKAGTLSVLIDESGWSNLHIL